MKIDNYAVKQLAPYMTGHKENGAELTGRELIDIFNKYGGFRDVYDNGLPMIRKGLNTSKKDYAENRLKQMINKPELSSLIEDIIIQSKNKEQCAKEINEIISANGYNVECINGTYKITGLIIKKAPKIETNAKFQEIEKSILAALDKAKVSIDVAVAWFSNEKLFNKLIEKKEQGLDVRIIINKDGVNKKHGVDITQLDAKEIRSERGGIMHDKFCVIDNQTVITGSYNWTNNAEFRNEENVNITENANALATEFSVKFKELWKQADKKTAK
ncbi:MAG: phosphatidylserine synthase [Prevotella sp.]|nr:phosphatidylserine synthase [Prevotella sp.]